MACCFNKPLLPSTHGDGQTMNWTFSLNGALPTDHLRFKTSTHAERNATYVHPDVTSIDRDVSVTRELTADASSQGDEHVDAGEVLPATPCQLDP